MDYHITTSQNMHLLVFEPEKAIITPETCFFRAFLGPFRSNLQECLLLLTKRQTLAYPTEPKLSWRWIPVGQIFKNNARKLLRDDPSVVAKKY